jgi:hypothetical protein
MMAVSTSRSRGLTRASVISPALYSQGAILVRLALKNRVFTPLELPTISLILMYCLHLRMEKNKAPHLMVWILHGFCQAKRHALMARVPELV